ncbi:metal ABC transporter substrate-binding protein [Catenuloplanes atrovinosus]|uniref:Zinc transport system substrate-binding protein n=1 Tax=Catenuloplanes atrovinosus TaxID=137266 RepID=A0AAE3YS05_9ACTN|nr:metal ABC transporter substrate-binding protein [Catenuloplanes atrovinosus]MDR7278570.1 zinc transport system substrate-binding protein [Catenuloplanes atrovinosus]
MSSSNTPGSRTSRIFRPRLAAVAATALLGATALAGCGDDGGAAAAAGDRLGVVAAFYPLQFVAERVGGDAVSVTNLVKPGAEPHDLELNPQQVGQLTDARLVVYLKGFQPAVDEAVAQNNPDRAFDASTAVPLLTATESAHSHEEGEEEHAEEEEAAEGGSDPHLWLDPTRLATVADAVAAKLGEADPGHAADFTARAAALRTELTALDAEFTAGLKTCERREIVTSHTAFAYLAERYQLEQIGISGISTEDEPSPQRLAEVAAEAKEHGATTIFFETLVSPKLAETIAQEVGAKAAVLDPIEGLADGASGDYFTVMRTNLTSLKAALGCS